MNTPTRPGWWWRQGNHGPYIEEVEGDQNHALYVSLSGTDVVDDGSWLAEVPAPDVCRAVADWVRVIGFGGMQAAGAKISAHVRLRDTLYRLYFGDAARKGQEVSE